MSWIRLDDHFLDHPKFLEAGPLAGYLHIAAIAWSNQHRTDGAVPWAQVERLVNWNGIAATSETDLHIRDDDVRAHPVGALELALTLVDCGLWERMANGAFAIHDYLDWQTPAAAIEQLSEKRALAGKKGAAARWHKSASDSPPEAKPKQVDGNTDGNTIARRKKKETTEKTSSSSSSLRPDPDLLENADPNVIRLSRGLATLVTRRDPKAIVKPDGKTWLKAMRLLIADRGGDVAEVERVMRWAHTGWWGRVILSPGSLREKFTQLVAAMADEPLNANGDKPAPNGRGDKYDRAAGLIA